MAVHGSNRIRAWNLGFLGILSCCTVAACVDLTPPWQKAGHVLQDAAAEDSPALPGYSDAPVSDGESAVEDDAGGADAGSEFPIDARPTLDATAGDQGADAVSLDVATDARDATPDDRAASADGPADSPAGIAETSDSVGTNDSTVERDSQGRPPIGSLAKLMGATFGTGPAFSGNPTASYEKAFDGDLATFFDDSHGSGGYAGIDLGTGASISVAVIRFYPRRGFNDRMVGGRFQCSSSSQTDGYVDLYTIGEVPPLAFTEVSIVDSPPCRFLRYLSGDGGNTNVAEIEFWAKAALDGGTGFADAGAPLSNLAVAKPVSASSEQSSAGKTAPKGNDGLLSTMFCPADNSFPVWYEVDLGAVYALRQMDLTVEISYTTYQYRIEVSTDDSTWTTLVDHQSDAVFGPATLADTVEASARFVRLTILGVAGQYWGCFKELAVWGYDRPLVE